MIYLSGSIQPELPAMIIPRMGQRPPRGQLWAADTGCFRRPETFVFPAYLSWLNELAADDYAETCLFATAPDRVGDAAATLQHSIPTLPYIREVGYPAALVAQDGLETMTVPWDDFDALFIGGTNAWRRSEAVPALAAQAHEQGKWLHMGRVNGMRGIRYAESIGCDSVDGTFLRFGPDTNRPRLDGWMAESRRRPVFRLLP
jgi:hypothetical protein